MAPFPHMVLKAEAGDNPFEVPSVHARSEPGFGAVPSDLSSLNIPCESQLLSSFVTVVNGLF